MKINGYTRTCGLIGRPVEHTMSPVIHNTLADRQGTDLVYAPLRVGKGRLEEAVKGAFALNLLGCNVTVPYKSEVIPFLDGIDPLAERIGAVNTLVRTGNGFKGYNTDMPGLYRAFLRDGVRIEGERVLILGAGGVARAVAVLLAEKGASQIVILNRTVEKAEAVAKEINSMHGKEVAQARPLSAWQTLMCSDKESGRKYLAVQATNVGIRTFTAGFIRDMI